MPSNVFLDNNICISWLLKEDPAIYNYVNDKVSESAAFISEYVLAEFIRTIVYDAIALLSILDDEIDLDGVKSRIYDIFENGNEHEQKAAERYIMLMNSIDFINGEDLDYAKIMIKFYARCSLKNLKKKIQILDSKLNCTLASKKPKREGLILKIEIPCESNINRANCSIMDYIKSEISFLNSIANGITGRSDFKKLNDLILTLNNCTLINCSLKHCKILGDVIILNDCPTDFIMVSKDHHFEKLCDITGHVLENF